MYKQYLILAIFCSAIPSAFASPTESSISENSIYAEALSSIKKVRPREFDAGYFGGSTDGLLQVIKAVPEYKSARECITPVIAEERFENGHKSGVAMLVSVRCIDQEGIRFRIKAYGERYPSFGEASTAKVAVEFLP